MSTTLTRKGQLTIPKPIRALLGLEPGSVVDFRVSDQGRVYLQPQGEQQRPASRFSALRGRATVKISTQEIMALTRGED